MTTPESRATQSTDQHLRALVIALRHNTQAMSDLAKALHGLVGCIVSDQQAPPDAEEGAPKKPKYLHPDDNS